jgi:hypothetical protein
MYSSIINIYIDKLVKPGEEQSKFGRESLDYNKSTKDKPGYIKGESKAIRHNFINSEEQHLCMLLLFRNSYDILFRCLNHCESSYRSCAEQHDVYPGTVHCTYRR